MKISIKKPKKKIKNKIKNKEAYNSELILQCKGLRKKYGSYYGVNNVNIEIEKGRIVGVLGPDGTGKSSLAKMIAGITFKSEGEILICGVPVGTDTKDMVSYMPEIPYYIGSTRIYDILELFRVMYSDFNYKRALKYLDSIGIGPKSTFGGVSATTAQIVQVIIVMCRRAQLYILDEPVAHLEPKYKDFVVKTILSNLEDDSAVLIFSKTATEIHKILDDVMFIHRGQIKLSGTAEEIKQEYNKDIDFLYKEVFRC